ncbi:MAG: hypothetical protein ACYS74_24165 [Planctomycetota bacterium]|jgi:hypothetical protein
MSDESKLSSRRDFLRCAAGGVVGTYGMPYVVPSSALGAGAPSSRINVGCIGTGNMGFTDLQGLLSRCAT